MEVCQFNTKHTDTPWHMQ